MKETPARFAVYVADNFHYMDEDETYVRGEYDSWDAAVTEARRIVDRCVDEYFKPGMSVDELFGMYTSFGDDPSIHPTAEDQPRFSGWGYARERCKTLCG